MNNDLFVYCKQSRKKGKENIANFVIHRHLHLAQQLYFSIACFAVASAHISITPDLHVQMLRLPGTSNSQQNPDHTFLTTAFAEAGTCQTT